ncbi:MAG: nicotinate-nucleotide--dimethylbenzimidazole phosphoribosyltransferase [Oscillospiraceae bacterium]
MKMLDEYLREVNTLDTHAMELSQLRWDTLAKPLNSLGDLESIICKISGMVGTPEVDISNKCVVVMCADNGIVKENVTQTDSSVTYLVARNMSDCISNINLMASVSNTDVFVVDIGMNVTVEDGLNIIDRKIAYGTKSFLEDASMGLNDTIKAIETGIELVETLKYEGYKIIATGEMGIGNTTTSSALASVLLGLPVEMVTGKGAGLSNSGLLHKIDVIKRGIALRKPAKNNPLDVLSKLGGFDIAGLVGIFIGGSIYRVPIVIDGFISSISALISYRLCPQSVDFMIPSHMSTEPASTMIMKELKLSPIIHANMHLGEGTGAVALFPLLDMAMKVYNSNRTFENIGMEAYKKL